MLIVSLKAKMPEIKQGKIVPRAGLGSGIRVETLVN